MKLITDNNVPDVECFHLNLSSFFSLKLNILIIKNFDFKRIYSFIKNNIY